MESSECATTPPKSCRVSRKCCATARRCESSAPRRKRIGQHGTLKYCADTMPARVSESFVLRTYPFQEADLIVSFFTRDQGKLRGVARRARRPKSAFGAGLERLSHVRMAYSQRENAELANLSSCEVIESGFSLESDYSRSLALDYMTEVSEQ